MLGYWQVEWIKLSKNRLFWIGLSIFAVFLTGVLKAYIINFRVKELATLMMSITEILALPIVFFNGFIPTLVGQQFKYNTLKFESIAGRTRLGQFFVNLIGILNYALFFGLVFVAFAVIYLLIDGRGVLPTFDRKVLQNFGLVFGIFFFYSYFLNTLTLLIRNVGLTMFVAFLYFLGNGVLAMSPDYADYVGWLPVGALYNLMESQAKAANPDLLLHISDAVNPYWVIGISFLLCLAINLWQFLRRDIQ